MKPKTLVLCVLAVLLLAGAAWQLVDRNQPEAAQAPLVAAEEPAAAPELPFAPAVVPAADDPANEAAMAAGKPPIKRTQLPDGKILIENQPLTLRHADGRVEERFVRMIAKPVKQKVSMKRPIPGKQNATATPQADPSAPPPAAVDVHAPGTGTPGSSGPGGEGSDGGASAGQQGAPAGGAADDPGAGGGNVGGGATPK
jgi:hypothetical protein